MLRRSARTGRKVRQSRKRISSKQPPAKGFGFPTLAALRKLSGAGKRTRKSTGEKVRTRKATPAAPVKRYGPEWIAAKLQAQKLAAKEAREHKAATAATRAFRVKAADKGKVVFVGVKGQRRPQDKGRKGFPIYVTKSGKKRLLKQRGPRPFKPSKVTDLDLPLTKGLFKPVAEFERSRLRTVKRQRPIRKGGGKTGKIERPGGNDFNKRVVGKLARSLKKTIEGQASQRVFVLSAFVLVKLPDGSTRTIEVNVPIEKPDHIAIKLGGMENFIKQKFYAFLARQLAFDGMVTTGSANHIRRLKQNEGLPQDEWTNKQGESWFGREDSEIVSIESIEWRIDQA